MTKFAQPSRQAKHTGKSGFISTQPRGGTPIPFSFFEEISSNAYPSVRNFVPPDYRGYADSYYDLRNEKYQFWYQKWGKPTIDKYMSWWKKNYAKIQTELQKAQKDYGKFSNTRPQYYGRDYSKWGNKPIRYSKSKHLCSRFCKFQYRSPGQRPYCKCRSSRRKTQYRYQYQTNNRRRSYGSMRLQSRKSRYYS